MTNDLISSRGLEVAFVLMMLTYLASAIPPLTISLRSYVEFIIAGGHRQHSWRRSMLITTGAIVVPLALAWRNPGLSEKAFSLTGATGVCIVCYIIPVVSHFTLMLRPEPYMVDEFEEPVQETLLHLPVSEGAAVSATEGQHGQHEQDATSREGSENGDAQTGHYMSVPTTLVGWCLHVAFPLLVLLVGCTVSALALLSASRKLADA